MLPGYKSTFSRSHPQQIIAWRFISTHLPSVTTADDRTQEVHDFHPKNGCDVCALKRGWSRAAIQTVAGGTPFVKSNGERGIVLRKRFVQKLTPSFERLSVPQIRLVEFPTQAWRGITAFEVTYQFWPCTARRKGGKKNEKRKCTFRRCQYLERVSFRRYSHFCRIPYNSHIYLVSYHFPI